MKQILHSFRTMLTIAALLVLSVNVHAVIFAQGDCSATGSNCRWYIERGTDNVYQLRISGTGRMVDYSGIADAPWYSAQPSGGNYFRTDYISRIVVEDGVTHISKFAFCEFSLVTSITLPNSVTSIGDYAFYRNTALVTLNLPSTTHITTVGTAPTDDCTALRTITGADVINGGWYTYPATELIAYPAASYAYSYSIADGCILLRERAFAYTSLYEVTLPASVEELEWAVFYQAANLTDIYAHPLTAPAYNTFLVTFPTGSSKTLADINLHIHNAAYASYSDTNLKWSDMNIVRDMDPDFEGECGANATYSFDPTTGTLTISGTGEMWDYTSWSGHTAPWKNWSQWADQYTYTDVLEVVIEEGITKVGESAFALCYNLSQVSFPSTLLTIGGGAFEWCGLGAVTLPENLQEIGASAFYRNQNLYSLTFTSTGEMIVGSNAFGMTALSDIYAAWTDGAFVPTLATGVFGTIDPEDPPTLHVKPGTGNFYTSRNVWRDLAIVDDNYNEDDLIPMMVYLELLNSDGTPVSDGGGGGIKAPAASGSGSGDCDFNVTFVDENGNPAEDNLSLYGLGILRACQQFGGIFWRGQSAQAIITPSTTSETYEFDHWEIDYSDYEALEYIQQSTLDHIYNNVTEDPTTHALTINLEYGIMPNYLEYGNVPLFPWNFKVYYKEKVVTPSYTVNLSVNIPYGGYIYGAESGTYEEGTELSLYAIPYPGYEFVEWSDGNTDNPRTVTITENVTFTASFKETETPPTPPVETFTVTVVSADETMGSVVGGGTFEKDTEVQIGALPNEGYEFVQWNDGNTDNPRSLVVTENTVLMAVFRAVSTPPVEEKTYYTVTLIANPTDGGTFLGAGQYEEGSTAVIAAQPNEGYEFVNWNDGVNTAARQLTVNDNIILVANFHRIGEGLITPSDSPSRGEKLLRNGILIIRVGDKEYNAQGQMIQ